MNVIFVPKMGGRGTSMRFSGATMFFVGAIFIFTVCTLVGIAYYLGYRSHGMQPSEFINNWHQELNAQRGEIEEVKRNADENLDALAMRLGQLQAHVIRLDALGGRLTTMAKLDTDEFDFNDTPPQGGPSYVNEPQGEQIFNVQEFLNSVNRLSGQLAERGQQLDFLETLLMSQNLEQEVVPQGRPVAKGWLSSYFGMRADPFTGRQEIHKGLDFAGKMGSRIVSVASGVVTWAGDRYGYGLLVEVDHGHGLATRYGHAQSVLVKVGDRVAKGDVLAQMGSSGRSTGPHVHFEVLKAGNQVDPLLYVKRK